MIFEGHDASPRRSVPPVPNRSVPQGQMLVLHTGHGVGVVYSVSWFTALHTQLAIEM